MGTSSIGSAQPCADGRDVVPDELPQNALLRAGARALNIADKVSSIGEWEPPPPYRYCWPVVG